MLAAMKKSETFTAPNAAQRALGAGMNPDVHGFSGPLNISYTPANGNSGSKVQKGKNGKSKSKRMYTDAYGDNFFSAASRAIGLRRTVDFSDGDIHGTGATTPNSIYPGSPEQLRVSSATAYLSPIEFSRPNLKVLTNWYGVRATYDTRDTLRVNGAIIQQRRNGPTRKIKAKKAVILAMGAIKTPNFLELSGIGDSSVLSPLGIDTKVDLPGVGRNLQDQTMNSISYGPKTAFQGEGPSSHIAMPSIYQLFSNASDVRSDWEASMDKYADLVVSHGGAVSADAVKKQWQLMNKQIWDQNVSVSELFVDHGYPAGGLGVDAWQLTVFSRGSVHVTDKSIFTQPRLDPGYFQLPIDMDITVAGLRASRKIYATSPLKENVMGELVPGFDKVPSGSWFGAYRRWRDLAFNTYSPVAHQLGTAQMAPRENGGVVDTGGAVYGISNGTLRVVDAAALNMQLSAHLSATLYGMAERFAEAIKADQ